LKIGRWAESKVVFKDTSIGRRGIVLSPRTNAFYKQVYIGRVTIPASSTAGTGGSVRVLKATHGLDSIEGGFGIERNPGAPGTPVSASVINASTIRLSIQGFTAATTYADVVIWGTSSA